VSALAPAVLLAAAMAPASAADCRTTDLMPAFWAYWAAARSESRDEQYRLFQEMVQKPNAAVYAGVFQGASKPPSEFVPRSLEKVPEIEGGMRELSALLSKELPGELEAFRQAFPGFRCSTPVYFVYSAGAFDGATRDVEGKTALMFGLDVIARLKEDLPPLVAHELFHVYHGEVVEKEPGTFGWALWSEGLATYVSRRLNPKVPEPQVCCLPPIGPARAAMDRLAPEARKLLDSEKREDYARYFLGGAADLDIPSRSGYYLGYLIATEAGKTRTLEELAAMTPAEVRALEVAELERLGAPRTPR